MSHARRDYFVQKYGAEIVRLATEAAAKDGATWGIDFKQRLSAMSNTPNCLDDYGKERYCEAVLRKIEN